MEPSLTNQKYITLSADGRMQIQTITFRDIGDQSAILEQIGGQLPVDIGGTFSLPNGAVCGMQRKNRGIYIYCPMEALKLNTWWRPYGSKPIKLSIVGIKGGDTDFEAAYIWKAPANMKLWLVGVWAPADLKTPDKYICSLVYLVAVKDKKFYRLPLPNLHTDGQVCMGRNPFKTAGTWEDRFVEVFEHFWSSPWNTDLRDNSTPESTNTVFGFKSDGDQLPVPEDWEKYCKIVNTSHYGDLPII